MDKRTEERMDRIEVKVDGFEGRFDRLKTKVDRLEGRFDNLEGKFDHLEGRFDRLETKVERVGKDVHVLQKDVRGLKEGQERLESHFVLFRESLDRHLAENKRYFEVLIELQKTESSILAEEVRANRERLDNHELRIQGLEAS